MELINDDLDQAHKKAPKGLVTLAILSFVNIGFSLLGVVSRVFMGPLSDDEIENQKVNIMSNWIKLKEQGGPEVMGDFYRQYCNHIETANRMFATDVISVTLILLTGLAGVILMLKGAKVGFHLYIIYSLLFAAQVLLFVAPGVYTLSMIVFGGLVSLFFILRYSKHLSWMK